MMCHVLKMAVCYMSILFFTLLLLSVNQQFSNKQHYDRRKVEIMHTHSLFTLLGERLMVHTNTVSVTVYNTLYEILTEQVCTQVVHKPHPEPDSTVKIQNPMILKVVATLLKNSAPSTELMEVRRLFLSDMIKLFSNSRENRRCLLQCSVWQDWMFSLCFINPKNSDEQKITEMVYNIFRILLYHAIKYEWGGWRVTYEAHKEYLAKMYEEYQRQEEENIKKGKKGFVSTISGLSAQASGINGVVEIREMDDNSNTPESEKDYESVDSRILLAEGKGHEEGMVDGVSVGVHDLLVDIKAEKVEATEVKLDDIETLGVSENGALVEVDSLLDSVYCAAAKKLRGSVDDHNAPPLITLDDDKDSIPHSNFLFGKVAGSMEDKLLPDLSTAEPLVLPSTQPRVHTSASDELGLLAHMTGRSELGSLPSILENDEFELQAAIEGISPVTGSENEASSKSPEVTEGTDGAETERNSSIFKTSSAADTTSNTSDTERSHNGRDKDARKIQTTATSQSTRPPCLFDGQGPMCGHWLQGAPLTEEQRRQFSPGPRTTMFRIPEFKWSAMHQRLLTDLLFALESDVHVWRSHSTKSVMDFVNSNENIIFVHNTIHLISQMTELENIEATQGMSSETAITFLSRLMVMVDVLVFSSSLNFSEIEAEKNMSSGGLMRQCLRLVCCVAVRNCLECRQRHRDRGNKSSIHNNKTQEILQNASNPSNLSPIKDPDRLLQDVDINRLRAVVFRDVVSAPVCVCVCDDSKQAQFLALAVVYFISVLMVSKYRDILEPQRETARISQSGRSMRQEINSPTSTAVKTTLHNQTSTWRAPFPTQTLVASITNGSDLEHSTGVLISTLSSEVKRSQESLSDSETLLKPPSSIISISQPKKGINVKEILKSLVASPVEGLEAGLEPLSYPDPAANPQAHAMLPMQFHSFDSLAVHTGGGSSSTSAGLTAGSTPNIFAAASATPKSMINTTGATDAAPSSSSSSSFVNGATSKNLPAVQTVAPMPEDTEESMSAFCEVDQCSLRQGQTPPELKTFSSLTGLQAASRDAGHITTKLERALEKVAPLLREIFVDFAPFLSRTLLGSHGQELLIEGLVCMKSSTSVVELVMLLCSQEWQNSIQKNAGLAFIELINEGRLLCHAMKDHIVRVANEAEFILNRQRAEDVHKHADFESNCAQYAADRKEEEKMCDHLISAAKHRDHLHDFWRLDYWEDDLRRRRRFVRNPFGSTHLDVTCKSLQEYGTEEDEVVKSKKVFRIQTVASQNPETELMLEGDEDAVSLLQEKEMDNMGGPVVLSSPAQLVAPVLVARGTLSITTTEIYFEVDEDDPAFKRVDSKVLAYTEGLHGKWMFSEIRAVFSRRYLLQNTAMEAHFHGDPSAAFQILQHDPALAEERDLKL
ncbi:hypothetical protein F7725_020510 [Dissostichus mawsoni]|uniref:BEACH-type PH domain-containing protein n=1 Tax=Dissostichus mawsoni TaxID=36200 RepID=A0A7J5YDF1_DISMA|nr:hypothetical protein F7725_020510 [Dissostichus mawsoni]